MDKQTDKNDRTAEFMMLFSQNSQRLYRFGRSLVNNRSEAEDVYQRACTVLWTKFDTFEPESNFWAWSCRIMRFEVLNYRRRQNIERRIFSDQFYEKVAERAVVAVSELDMQHSALADCYQFLSARQKELVEKTYEPDATTKSVAKDLGRTPSAIYKSLRRAHETLFECIQSKLSAGDIW